MGRVIEGYKMPISTCSSLDLAFSLPKRKDLAEKIKKYMVGKDQLEETGAWPWEGEAICLLGHGIFGTPGQPVMSDSY
jgi:hypothetical protein